MIANQLFEIFLCKIPFDFFAKKVYHNQERVAETA